MGRNNHYKLETQLTEAIPQTLDGHNTSRRVVCVLKDSNHIIHNKKKFTSQSQTNFSAKTGHLSSYCITINLISNLPIKG